MSDQMKDKGKHDSHVRFKNDERKEEDWLDDRKYNDKKKRDYQDY